MKSKMILLTAVISALVCLPAQADFLYTIDGHGPNGTHQTWDDWTGPVVETGANYLKIEADHFHGSPVPTASIFAEPEGAIVASGPFLTPGDNGAGTVYASPIMQIVLDIPNVVNEDLLKIVQATLVYQTQDTPESGFMSAFLVPEGESAIDPLTTQEETVDGWTTLQLEWTFPQLYASEQITILLHDSGVTLDRIVVQTQCIPLPGAVLLGLLGLAAAGRKLRALC